MDKAGRWLRLSSFSFSSSSSLHVSCLLEETVMDCRVVLMMADGRVGAGLGEELEGWMETGGMGG